ncbi:MAG: acyltransferase domain-containing protein [Nitrospirota bacterium]
MSESDGAISIAAVNGPKDLTLAGDHDYLNEVRRILETQEIFARPLTVDVPYHSPMMEPLKPALMEALQHLQPNAPILPLYSTVTGSLVPVSESVDAKKAAALSVTHGLARYIADVAAPKSGDRALVCGDALGSALAEQLKKFGVIVIPFPDHSSAWTMANLDEAQADGKINLLAAPLDDWEAIYGFDLLSDGVNLINLGLEKKGRFEPIHCTASVSRLIRVDWVNAIQQDREKMRDAMMSELDKVSESLMLSQEISLEQFMAMRFEEMTSDDSFTLHYREGSEITVKPSDSPNLKEDATYLR